MKALVMAGGKGTRLYPYSATLPKPLMPIGDVPVLEILLRQLASAGVDEAVIAVNHLRHLIEAFFGDGSRFGIRISYSLEDQPLGTAGPIGQVIDDLSETFVVTNGDLLTTLDMRRMIETHAATRADVTIGAHRVELRSDFGVLDVDASMRMVEYREKPAYSHLVSMGFYVMQREAIRPFVGPNQPLSIPDLLRAMAAEGRDIRCFEDDCFWLDIGRPDDFARAQEEWQRNPALFGGRSAG